MKPAAKIKSQKSSKSNSNRQNNPSAATSQVQAAAVINSTMVDDLSVAQRAYELWQRGACQHGKDLEHWLTAEKELRNTNSSSSQSL